MLTVISSYTTATTPCCVRSRIPHCQVNLSLFESFQSCNPGSCPGRQAADLDLTLLFPSLPRRKCSVAVLTMVRAHILVSTATRPGSWLFRPALRAAVARGIVQTVRPLHVRMLVSAGWPATKTRTSPTNPPRACIGSKQRAAKANFEASAIIIGSHSAHMDAQHCCFSTCSGHIRHPIFFGSKDESTAFLAGCLEPGS